MGKAVLSHIIQLRAPQELPASSDGGLMFRVEHGSAHFSHARQSYSHRSRGRLGAMRCIVVQTAARNGQEERSSAHRGVAQFARRSFSPSLSLFLACGATCRKSKSSSGENEHSSAQKTIDKPFRLVPRGTVLVGKAHQLLRRSVNPTTNQPCI